MEAKKARIEFENALQDKKAKPSDPKVKSKLDLSKPVERNSSYSPSKSVKN